MRASPKLPARPSQRQLRRRPRKQPRKHRPGSSLGGARGGSLGSSLGGARGGSLGSSLGGARGGRVGGSLRGARGGSSDLPVWRGGARGSGWLRVGWRGQFRAEGVHPGGVSRGSAHPPGKDGRWQRGQLQAEDRRDQRESKVELGEAALPNHAQHAQQQARLARVRVRVLSSFR